MCVARDTAGTRHSFGMDALGRCGSLYGQSTWMALRRGCSATAGRLSPISEFAHGQGRFSCAPCYRGRPALWVSDGWFGGWLRPGREFAQSLGSGSRAARERAQPARLTPLAANLVAALCRPATKRGVASSLTTLRRKVPRAVIVDHGFKQSAARRLSACSTHRRHP